jgi:hypothetical protein
MAQWKKLLSEEEYEGSGYQDYDLAAIAVAAKGKLFWNIEEVPMPEMEEDEPKKEWEHE